MKKIILGISLFSLILLALGTTHVLADDKPNHGHDNGDNHNNGSFNADSQLVKSQCGNRLGDPIINVTQKVQNDADSGFGTPTYWAFDYYTRHIQVWQTATSTYCAVVTYDGNFYSVPGQGQPGDSSGTLKIDASVNQPINGDQFGGYRAILTGTLNPSPTWPTNGNVGTTNYKCDLSGICPGIVSWLGVYFNPTPTFDYSWWGWQYKAGSHGTWVNECANGTDTTAPANNPACLGSSGNIL